jgi:hypothetical protein
MGCPFCLAHFALPISAHSFTTKLASFVPPLSSALAILGCVSPGPETAGKSARADFPIDFLIKDTYRLNVINGDPVTKSAASSQADHNKPYDTGNANDFVNELLIARFSSDQVPSQIVYIHFPLNLPSEICISASMPMLLRLYRSFHSV